MNIYNASLNNYKNYPTRFCLPSHLNRIDFSRLMKIDNTELDGLDDLANPSGIIAELEGRLARLFSAPYLHITTNGASGANMAALGHIAQNHKQITIQRDSHISMYRLLHLHDIIPDYLPPLGDPDFVTRLQNKNTKTPLWLTTPTYSGLTITPGVLRDAAPYIHADSALGSLFPVFGRLNYLEIADSVTYSGHKGFPALTQTGFLAGKGDMRAVLNSYNSTSPSYILIAGIEKALEYIESGAGDKWPEIASWRERVLRECEACESTPDNKDYVTDVTKLTITGIDGFRVYDELLNHGVVVENCGVSFITLFFSILHQDCDIDNFITAYNRIRIKNPGLFSSPRLSPDIYIDPVVELTPYQAKKIKNIKSCGLNESIGRISASLIYLYPPGAPLLLPGERITTDIADYIRISLESGYTVSGLDNMGFIQVF